MSFCNWNLNTLSKNDFYRVTLLEAHNHNFVKQALMTPLIPRTLNSLVTNIFLGIIQMVHRMEELVSFTRTTSPFVFAPIYVLTNVLSLNYNLKRKKYSLQYFTEIPLLKLTPLSSQSSLMILKSLTIRYLKIIPFQLTSQVILMLIHSHGTQRVTQI